MTDNVTNAAVVVAIVQAVKSFVPAQVQGWVTILVAAFVGGALAFTQSTDIIQGVVVGLSAAGVITGLKSIGK